MNFAYLSKNLKISADAIAEPGAEMRLETLGFITSALILNGVAWWGGPHKLIYIYIQIIILASGLRRGNMKQSGLWGTFKKAFSIDELEDKSDWD